jgi:hypothetical protein
MLTRIWLTLKQHRFETVAVIVLCLGVSIAALVEAFRLNALNTPLSCLVAAANGGGYGMPNGSAPTPCDIAATNFYNLAGKTDMDLTGKLIMFVPFIVGILFGAPLVAREIETGTAPLSWALRGSRWRWLAARMLAVCVLLVPLLLVVGIAAWVFVGARNPTVDMNSAFLEYLSRGSFPVFWGLAAFAGTVALGTLIGRSMPAVFVALVICFFVRGVWEPGMARIVLKPLAVQQTAEMSYASYTNDRYSYGEYFLDGKPWTGDYQAWWNAHQQTGIDTSGNGGGVVMIGPGSNPIPLDAPAWVNFMIPGKQLWPISAIESGFLLLGTLLCSAIALVWVGRRRPY